MIGFELRGKAEGGFSFFESRWSEGSLVALKAAISASKNPAAKAGQGGDVIDAIEATFGKLKQYGLDEICTYHWNMRLVVTGSFHFIYDFVASKSYDLIRLELLQKINNQRESMRDQVIISFCNCIKAYRTKTVLSNGPFRLEMTINL